MTASAHAHTRALLTAARKQLADLSAKKTALLNQYRTTGEKRHELKAWLLEDEISRARRAVRDRAAELGVGDG